MRVAVVGLGYVGCVTAACLAESGHEVIGIDPVAVKVEAINRGATPVVEPGLGELVSKNVEDGRMRASTDIADLAKVDVAIVCVGTPSAPSGELDLTFVTRVAREIGATLAERTEPLSIILRSTVLPSTTQEVFARAVEDASGLREGEDFFVAFTPEFLRESTAIADFYDPPFMIVGVESDASADAARELFGFLDVPVQVVATGVAESLKYACNAFHAVKVGFANEIGRISEASGVDGREVMRLFVQDTQLNISAKYLRPGFAYGGSCLPKDVNALRHHATAHGESLPIIDSLAPSKEEHIDRVIRKVRQLRPKKIVQVGLAFKPLTDDLRESPYLRALARLREDGFDVSAFDPVVDEAGLIGANRAYVAAVLPDLADLLSPTLAEACDGADVVLLGTNDAAICEALLGLEDVTVIDVSGMLSPQFEQRFRARKTSGGAAYAGAVW